MIVKPLAVAGPKFVAIIVKVTLLPIITGLAKPTCPPAPHQSSFRPHNKRGSSVVTFNVQPPAIFPKTRRVVKNKQLP